MGTRDGSKVTLCRWVGFGEMWKGKHRAVVDQRPCDGQKHVLGMVNSQVSQHGLPLWLRWYNVGDLGWIPGLGRSPGEGNGYFLPGESHGLRSLESYSPWGHKVQDTTERLSTQHSLVQLWPWAGRPAVRSDGSGIT